MTNAQGQATSTTAVLGVRAGCYPDCDQDGAPSIDDFLCFQTFFAIGC